MIPTLANKQNYRERLLFVLIKIFFGDAFDKRRHVFPSGLLGTVRLIAQQSQEQENTTRPVFPHYSRAARCGRIISCVIIAPIEEISVYSVIFFYLSEKKNESSTDLCPFNVYFRRIDFGADYCG
jgi:hypothetical protein